MKRIHDLLLHFSDQQENVDMVPDLHFLEKDKYAPLQRSKCVHPHSPWGQGLSLALTTVFQSLARCEELTKYVSNDLVIYTFFFYLFLATLVFL